MSFYFLHFHSQIVVLGLFTVFIKAEHKFDRQVAIMEELPEALLS